MSDPFSAHSDIDNDLCITCGKEVPSDDWGGKCEEGHLVVHQCSCDVCKNPIGQITDDDFCGPEVLICSACMNKAREGGLKLLKTLDKDFNIVLVKQEV